MPRLPSNADVLATKFFDDALTPYLRARRSDDVTPREFAALLSGFNIGARDSVSIVHLDVILWRKLEDSEFSMTSGRDDIKLLVQARNLTQQSLKFPGTIIAPIPQS
jgi:hypothetical protein